ncbi:hypothetical protein NEOLEDRAFT_1170839 [Neolentinus lepideus HHB14362 ss-1]|uniref:Uncharacterized protein n=1 Tax=Neolentinus lepideus HHB14362 ss-1 TaxID=1314782 RepID=A0A165R587_9AGAM|nr:hypothetical protein NEOLEDRAFT_1170839 [Neolentinus lepideus HHB14362 ss-1]
MVHINTLPKEIISQMFKAYITSCLPIDNSYAPPPHPSQPYEWTKLMLVCRQWANILGGDNSSWFWNTIVITSDPDATDTILERSQKAQLSVTGTLADARQLVTQYHIQRFQHVSGRIRSLDIATSRAVLRLWNDSTDMANLEVLKVTQVKGGHLRTEDEGRLLARFEAPKLRKLELRGFSWKAIEPVLKGDLEEVILKGNTLIPTAAFLRALHRMPKLRVLSIQCDMQSIRRERVANVSLPNLQSVSGLIGNPVDVEYLAFVRAPSLHYLAITMSSEDDDDLQQILLHIRQVLTSVADNCNLRNARIYAPSPKGIDVVLTEGDAPIFRAQRGIDLSLCVEKQARAMAMLSPILNHTLRKVEKLVIPDAQGYSGEKKDVAREWSALCRQMPHVRVLHLQGHGVNALRNGLDYHQGGKTYGLIFPKLESVLLDGVRFRPPGKGNKWGFWHGLKRSLMRQDMAGQINNLTVYNGFEFYQKDFDALTSLNLAVEWDMIERKK